MRLLVENKHNNRIVWDDCIATGDRRPSTVQDIKQGIHVKEFKSSEDMLNFLLDWEGYYDTKEEYVEDNLDEEQVYSNEEIIESIIDNYSDSSDGSANILYCSVDGKELTYEFPDSLEDLDLSTCSEKDIIKAMINYYYEE